MERVNKLLTVGLTLSLVPAILVGMFVPFALAQPTSDSFGVEHHASGYKNTTVSVPVTIVNTQNGPITCIIFDISYDNSVISVVDVKEGTITNSWNTPAYCNFEWGTKLSIAYTGEDETALQNGSSGSIMVLKFRVVGEAGEKTDMSLNNIQLSDLSGENVGFDTAPAKNATFTVLTNLTQIPSSTYSPSSAESPLPILSPSSAPTATSAATQSPPGFNAIFAIVCSLAVAYLVMRRRKAQP